MGTNTIQHGYWFRSLRKAAPIIDPRYLPGKKCYARLVGVQFEGRLLVVAKLKIGEEVLLRREPTNQFDFNAICVERLTGEQIGYIKRIVAANLVVPLDDYGKPVKGEICDLRNASYKCPWPMVWVSFTIPYPNGSTNGGFNDDDL